MIINILKQGYVQIILYYRLKYTDTMFSYKSIISALEYVYVLH